MDNLLLQDHWRMHKTEHRLQTEFHHLQSRDSMFTASQLEIHVSHVIFNALNQQHSTIDSNIHYLLLQFTKNSHRSPRSTKWRQKQLLKMFLNNSNLDPYNGVQNCMLDWERGRHRRCSSYNQLCCRLLSIPDITYSVFTVTLNLVQSTM